MFPQSGASTNAREAPWPRGHACRDGAHPHSDLSGGTGAFGAVEATPLPLLPGMDAM